MINKEKKIVNKKLVTYLNNKVFTGCGLGFSWLKQEKIKSKFFYVGSTDEKEGSAQVGENSFFDVASLTKPMVTVLSLLALIKDGKIHFEDKLANLLPGYIPGDKKNIKIIELISHCSGLPSHRPYYKDLIKVSSEERKKNIIKYILDEKLEQDPGNSYIYSDLDYILLGHILEERSEEKLERYWSRKITDPLNITSSFRFSTKYQKENEKKFVVTGSCPWTTKPLSGVVHDDNCRALGQLSGHAGLFSTLKGVSALCENLLLVCSKISQHPSFKTEDLLYLLKKRKPAQRPCGFDIPSGQNSGSGQYFSDESVGHLGFTGTSFWMDLTKKKLVVLLTNRTIFGEDAKKIKKMRPDIHNTVMSLL